MDQKRLLERNMFVIVPTRAYKNMNEVYKTSRKNNFSIFVTTDSILHTTHLLFDYLLKTTELDHLMGDLKQLTASLIKASLDDYKATKDDKLKKFFDDLKASNDLGAVLAIKYGKRSKEIGEKLVSDNVAAEVDHVNTVMLTGFYHAYGPVNNYFD
jgi:predicted phage tail protein